MNDIKPFRWLENLGKIRDGLLLFTSAIYMLGYFVWALVAWSNNLGPLPVLRAQYFVAGVPIFIAITVVFILIRLLLRMAFKWWPLVFDKLSLRNQQLVSWITIAIALLFYVVWMCVPGPGLHLGLDVAIILTLLVFFIFYPSCSQWEKFKERLKLSRQGKENLLDKVDHFLSSAMNLDKVDHFLSSAMKLDKLGDFVLSAMKVVILNMVPILLGMFLISRFISAYYLKLPQEFGGAKPRLAVLDLVKSKFSVPTLNEIVDSSKVQANSDVLPSRQVIVYFTGSDHLLIEKTDTTTTKKGILEIPRDAIVAIHWLKGMQDSAEALADTSRTKKK